MSRSDGFDLFVENTKVGSFQTSIRDNGTREMYVFLTDGSHLHLGAEAIDGMIGRSFGRASNISGDEKMYAGDGVVNVDRSTEDIATFVVEKTADGLFRTSFKQGEYHTEPVETSGLRSSREQKYLPWNQGMRKVEYGVRIYDVQSHVPSGSVQVVLEYSSASTEMGIGLTIRGTEMFNT